LQHFEERLREEGVEVDEHPMLDGSDTGTGIKAEGVAIRAQDGAAGVTGEAKKEARIGAGRGGVEALEPCEDENELEEVCSVLEPPNAGGEWNVIETVFHPPWILDALPKTPNPCRRALNNDSQLEKH
jgi:hypothetical protein